MDQPDADTTGNTPNDQRDVSAFLEHLTGPSRGRVQWLSQETRDVLLDTDNILTCARPAAPVPDGAEHIATLTWKPDGCHLSATGRQDIWLNRQKVTKARLRHLDMIEFGATGPMSRFRYCDQSYPNRWPVDDIVSDAIAYARTSRRPFAPRMSQAVVDGGRRLAMQTTVFFRVAVTLSLVALAALGYLLYKNDRQFEDRLRLETQRIAAISAALTQTQSEALTPDDLSALRAELETRLMTNAERLDSLEYRSDATARVIRASARSVVFLQGAFGLRHAESGAFLRHVVDANGNRMTTPFGQPWIDPTGTGDIAEFQATGTGFLIQDAGRIVTNRHVARPWTARGQADAFLAAGLEPEMLAFVAYLPGLAGAQEITLTHVSETEDLAILTLQEPPQDRTGLRLAPQAARAGEEVILIGYPTGLRALLAQAGAAFLDHLETAGEAEFWQVAARLSEQDLIWPLSSRGIVAQAGAAAILYDAETTVGGSGGPVLNALGQVIAVNTAILPEFGGSNMGLPVSHLRELLGRGPTQ